MYSAVGLQVEVRGNMSQSDKRERTGGKLMNNMSSLTGYRKSYSK